MRSFQVKEDAAYASLSLPHILTEKHYNNNKEKKCCKPLIIGKRTSQKPRALKE